MHKPIAACKQLCQLQCKQASSNFFLERSSMACKAGVTYTACRALPGSSPYCSMQDASTAEQRTPRARQERRRRMREPAAAHASLHFALASAHTDHTLYTQVQHGCGAWHLYMAACAASPISLPHSMCGTRRCRLHPQHCKSPAYTSLCSTPSVNSSSWLP
jgi:hypothetical protein